MEDRKRLFDQVDLELAAIHKKLDHLSDKGPLTQLDVVYFKKEAIWRQMNLYKLQASELTREVASYDQKLKTYIAAHLLLEAWYKQVATISGAETPPDLDLGAGKDAVDARLAERQQMLARVLKPLASDTDAQVLDAVRLAAEKEAAEQQRTVTADQLAAAQAEVRALQRQADRQALATVQRVLDGAHAREEEAVKPENPTTAGAAPESADATSAMAEALEQLRVEHAQVAAAHAALQEQVASTDKELAAAHAQAAALRERLELLSEADLAKCTAYVAAVERNKALGETVATVTRLKDELVERVRELEDAGGDVRRRVDRELADENRQLKETLTRTECDLVRIRTARDELLAKQTLLKLEMESRKTNDDLQRMNRVLHERLQKLEGKDTTDSNGGSGEGSNGNGDAGDAGAEDPFAQMDRAQLVQRLQILTREMKDIEQAFQDTRALAMDRMKDSVQHENLVKKLTIEKTKADQKYFASMRVKDALAAENKVLKSQMAKLLELVAKLNDLEKSYLAKIDLLTKSSNDLRIIKEGSIHETTKLHDTVKLLGKAREAAAREVHLLKADVAALKLENADLTRDIKTRKVTEAKLEAKLRSTESLLLKYKLNNTSSILQEDEKQLEALRAIAKCSVCLKNWKNTAITACGHVFCDGCVQERLAARLRRCPSCNKGFSSNDLLSIHL